MKRFSYWLLPCLAALVPCALLINPYHYFNGDGTFHLWYTAYAADYLHYHWSFPLVLNSIAQSGNTVPLLYGSLFIPLAAPLALILGAAGSIRLLAFLVFLIQIQSVRGLFRRAGSDPLWGWAIALSTAWAIYPLTNLYSRSALPEFFAAGFVFIGIVWFLSSGFEPPGKTKNRLVTGALILGTIGAGTHPITAYLTLGVLPLALLVYLAKSPQKWSVSITRSIGALLLCLGLLSPWLTALHFFAGKLEIERAYLSLRTFDFDRLWVRLFPLPVDPRTFSAPLESIPTPFCDTQISIAVAIAFLFFYSLNFRKLSWASRMLGLLIFLVGLVILGMSVRPGMSRDLNHHLRIAQFGYRLITPVNWMLFLGAFLSTIPVAVRKSEGASRWIAILLIALSSVGVVIKLNHATAVMSVADSSLIGPSYLSSEQHRQSPANFDPNGRDYCIKFLEQAESETAGIPRQPFNFTTGHGADFGQVLPSEVTFTESTRIQTNMLEHPWNTILVDGVTPPKSKLFEGREYWTDVLIEPGTHTLSYEFRPAPQYKTALIVRDFCAIGLLILLFI